MPPTCEQKLSLGRRITVKVGELLALVPLQNFTSRLRPDEILQRYQSPEECDESEASFGICIKASATTKTAATTMRQGFSEFLLLITDFSGAFAPINELLHSSTSICSILHSSDS